MKKIIMVSGVLVVVAGVVMVIAGTWGALFTYRNVAREKITTPSDAPIPNTLVGGPFTLKSQADIIRTHTLHTTGDKTYAEMPQQVAKLDEKGVPVLGADGKPVMAANAARNIWVTATTLTTALNLGILTYAFSALTIFLGLVFILTGILFYVLGKRY